MIMDVAHHSLFGPPRIIDECELEKPPKFLHLKFNNKGIYIVNITNILNYKNAQFCIPPYFNEMAKIPKSDQSQNTSREYKSEK
jgi:hypothetical protein